VTNIQKFIRQHRFGMIAALLLPIESLACGTQDPAMTFTGTVIPEIEGGRENIATLFIWAVTTRNGTLAYSTLSAEAQTVVRQSCNDGNVISCFSAAGLLDKGRPEYVFFEPEHSNDSTAVYHVAWYDDTSTWVVVEIVDQNGELRVSSARGWVTCEQLRCEVPQELIEGTDKSYLFPPQE
jgi:hypothetical protein